VCEKEGERERVVCAGENRSSFIFHWTCRFAYICLAQRRKIALVLISFARRRFILNPTHRTENGENPTIFAHTSHSLPLAVVRPPVTHRILTAQDYWIERNRHTALLYDRHPNETNTNNFIEFRGPKPFWLAKAVIRFCIAGQTHLDRGGEKIKLKIRKKRYF